MWFLLSASVMEEADDPVVAALKAKLLAADMAAAEESESASSEESPLSTSGWIHSLSHMAKKKKQRMSGKTPAKLILQAGPVQYVT